MMLDREQVVALEQQQLLKKANEDSNSGSSLVTPTSINLASSQTGTHISPVSTLVTRGSDQRKYSSGFEPRKYSSQIDPYRKYSSVSGYGGRSYLSPTSASTLGSTSYNQQMPMIDDKWRYAAMSISSLHCLSTKRIEKILYLQDCSLMTNCWKRIFLVRDVISISKIFLEYLRILFLIIDKYVNVSMCANEWKFVINTQWNKYSYTSKHQSYFWYTEYLTEHYIIDMIVFF